MKPQLTLKEMFGLALIFLGTLISVYYGWDLFWFLTDDAYIAFRYVSNSQLGYGYVWNPPPFRPVEGYTSFLWVVLLDVVWRVLGVEPPDSATYLSLIFTYLTLLLGAMMVLKMSLTPQLQRYRVLFLALVLLGVISNRTFLAWTSSGLETAMFNFCFTLWIFACLFLPAYSSWWVVGITSAATLIYLTRPDGLLIAVVTVGLVSLAGYTKLRTSQLSSGDLVALLPWLAIPIHLAWRQAVYGEWLPNTYYAKRIAGRIWPESGIRYLLSFVMEYSLWIWLILLLILIFRKLGAVRLSRMLLLDMGVEQAIWEPIQKHIPANHNPDLKLGWIIGAFALGGLGVWLAGQPFWGAFLIILAVAAFLSLGVLNLSLIKTAIVLTLLVHVGYYTIIIGGDHFEFRVYSHLILLIFISFLWFLSQSKLHVASSALLFVLFILLSWPISWGHWAITHHLTTREETGFLKASLAQAAEDTFPELPNIVLKYLTSYDDLQFWLIDHAVGMRHQEHQVFHLYLVDLLAPREDSLSAEYEAHPVFAANSVGVIAWFRPKINIIDAFGLNDYVIARNPELHGNGLMAHERKPPPGYLECFAPDDTLSQNKPLVTKQVVDLTAETIIECEQRYADMLRNEN